MHQHINQKCNLGTGHHRVCTLPCCHLTINSFYPFLAFYYHRPDSVLVAGCRPGFAGLERHYRWRLLAATIPPPSYYSWQSECCHHLLLLVTVGLCASLQAAGLALQLHCQRTMYGRLAAVVDHCFICASLQAAGQALQAYHVQSADQAHGPWAVPPTATQVAELMDWVQPTWATGPHQELHA
jgi:hypothetical protein